MRSNFIVRFSLGLLGLCLFIGHVGEVKAQWASARSSVNLVCLDDYRNAPSDSFQKDQPFDSLEQAFLSPEKVTHLVLQKEDPAMKHLPSRLGTLINLEALEISCLENLEDLPDEIGKLRKLEKLIIDNGNGCQMNISLPRSVGQLENLKVLRLYGALDPREIGSEEPTPRSKIKSFPETIANLQQLEELDLGRNGLESIPAQIASLRKLKRLLLDYNDIHVIPSFVGNLKNLEELSLRSNGGVKLPASLANIKGLKVSMGNNALKLRDQAMLRSRFRNIVFSFENEYDDSVANEEPAAPKAKARRNRRR